jgi:very-short-patch-repair endonuclease
MRKKIEKLNWKKIQNFYDENNTWIDVIKEFNLTNYFLSKAVKLGLFKTRGISESIKIRRKKDKFNHSEETKKKISDIRKKYLIDNPDKVPYRLNHSSKESYPEKYFSVIFDKRNIIVERYFNVGIYELDFCIPEKKIDIEIDGSQHYYDEKIIESDKRRSEFLEKDGWDIVRINWAEYQKFDFEEKVKYIDYLIDYISDMSNKKPTFEIKKVNINKDQNFCNCGEVKYKSSDICRKCFLINKCEGRPKYEDLKREVELSGFVKTGKKYEVSGNAIKKWILNYENHEFLK